MVQAQTRYKWSEGPKALALMRCFHSRRATVFKELSNENSALDKINPPLISGALTVAAGIETGPIALGDQYRELRESAARFWLVRVL